MLNWNDLKIFLAVAEKGSLAEAALHLGVSHATVFRRLNAFETKIGVRLFERARGAYEVTKTGAEMREIGRNISESFHGIERRIVGKDKRPAGLVKLTAPTSFSYNNLPRHLRAFSRRYPKIDIDLVVSNEVLNLSERQSDVALRVAESPPDHLVGRQVGVIEWGVYASKRYLEQHGTPKGLKDLRQHHIIGASGQLRTHPTFRWLEGQSLKQASQRTDDLMAMANMALANMGLALIPDDLYQPGLHRCFTLNPVGKNKLWILTHPDLRGVERISVLMRFLANKFSGDLKTPVHGAGP